MPLPRVLAVDDDPILLEVLKGTLTRAGYEFVPMTSARKCLALSGHLMPRLILLDIEMPDIDGFKLCRLLRDKAETFDTPIAFLSVHKDRETISRGLSCGANDFLVKPLDPVRLVERVRRWVWHKPVKSAAPLPSLN